MYIQIISHSRRRQAFERLDKVRAQRTATRMSEVIITSKACSEAKQGSCPRYSERDAGRSHPPAARLQRPTGAGPHRPVWSDWAACGAGKPGSGHQSQLYTCLLKAPGSVRHRGRGQARSSVLSISATQGQQHQLALEVTEQGASASASDHQPQPRLRKGCGKRRRRPGTAPSTSASC